MQSVTTVIKNQLKREKLFKNDLKQYSKKDFLENEVRVEFHTKKFYKPFYECYIFCIFFPDKL